MGVKFSIKKLKFDSSAGKVGGLFCDVVQEIHDEGQKKDDNEIKNIHTCHYSWLFSILIYYPYMNMFKPNSAATPEEYIALIEDEARRSDVKLLDKLIREVVPNWKPYIMSNMLSYGTYHYTYASGREGDWMIIALASQKNYISLYVCATEGDRYIAENYKEKLPKASIGKSCIRFKKISDIDLDVLREILHKGAKWKFSDALLLQKLTRNKT